MAIVVVFFGLVAAAALRSGSDVLLADDFDDGTGEWFTGEDEFGSLSFRDGGYHMSSSGGGGGNFARHLFSESVPGLSFEARSTAGREVRFIGLSCWESQSTGYDLLVLGGRSFEIQRWTDLENGDSSVIARRGEPGPPGFFEEDHRVRIECASTGSGSTRLSLFVDGERIGALEDPQGGGPFTGVGLEMGTGAVDAEILFDDVEAIRLESG